MRPARKRPQFFRHFLPQTATHHAGPPPAVAGTALAPAA